MSQPLVSILMGVHNGEKYLAASITSILLQTFKDFEFIIVDDGSTDSSAKIIDAFAGKDSRIRPVHQENKGLTRTLNIAAKLARGSYLARQDADDISLPKRLEQQVKYSKKHPDVKIVGTSNYMLDDRGKVINRFLRPGSTELIKKYMPFGNQLCHGSVLIEKEFFDQINGYDEDYKVAQDYELWLRTLSKGYEINNLRWPLYMWRIHSGSIAGSKIELQNQTVEKILNTYLQVSFASELIYDVGESFILDKYYLMRGLMHAGFTSLRHPELQVRFL